ncbi:MAG: valine--tRNA ligase [Acidobacteriota bacterium]
MSFTAHFEHGDREPAIRQRWEESGAFQAKAEGEKPAYTISMPPPNATGTLHVGHVVMLALEDLMIRWRRMKGDEVLWVPGTDHAAIATESVVIKQLKEEGMEDPRGELGRDELVRRIAEFVEGSRSTIRSQIQAVGSSCDWSRERYTMDAALNRCVNEVFARMFRDGLIYRGKRIVNWDPTLQTTVSDDEVYHEERPAKLYTIRYGPFLVATSRPETKIGDTAVAVHPDDERWAEHVGKTYTVPWPKGPTIEIKVVADRKVDPETGTGALGVTPAHSHVDFEIAQSHDLPVLQVIGEDGRMTEAAGPYAGMTVMECRKAFVADLEEAGLLESADDYQQQTSLCYRSKKAIEPLPKEQWFIDVNKPVVPWKGRHLSMRQVLREVVESGDIEIFPDYSKKTYFHWIDNLRDWCVSRQIWWGHRVPVFYRGNQEIYVGHRQPEGEGWTQDDDSLDTWFSSALWTWSTLVDADLAADPDLNLEDLLERSPDFQRFHPTSVMETGYDILFFWVARMILMTTYVTGQVPFKNVYLHGLILDRDGDKMSKSKPETQVDPQDVIGEKGADTLRLALVLGAAAGQDLRVSDDRLTACQRLVNKLWNASKLVAMSLGDGPPPAEPDSVTHPINRWMLAELSSIVADTDRRFAEFNFGDGSEKLRASFWNEFCDLYLEAIKVEDLKELDETRFVLSEALSTYLHLFHPMMPFVTEEIWSQVGREGLLATSAWPEQRDTSAWANDVAGVQAVSRLISSIRRIKVERKLATSSSVEAVVATKEHAQVLAACRPVVERLARTGSLELVDAEGWTEPDGASTAVDAAFVVAVSVGEADLEKERERLEKQLEQSKKRREGLEKRLGNPAFVEKAKPEVVEAARSEAATLDETLAELEARLAKLGS